MKAIIFGPLLVLLLAVMPAPAVGQVSTEEVRSIFEKFVVAQNAHDLGAVESLLSDSPNFLWITKGTSVWGRKDALRRFEDLFQGTWHLEPDYTEFKVVFAQPTVAQVFVPIVFSIGPPGQPPQEIQFLMNQTMARNEFGWEIISILPIPVPVPSLAPAAAPRK